MRAAKEEKDEAYRYYRKEGKNRAAALFILTGF
jgi:hypothetical protein